MLSNACKERGGWEGKRHAACSWVTGRVSVLPGLRKRSGKKERGKGDP